jgi:hypothetical protein
MNARLLRVIPAALAVVAVTASTAHPLSVTERRGDFSYDAQGTPVIARHAEMPAGFERQPMSHREKFQLMGIQLPPPRTDLVPRAVAPKPAQVDAREGLLRDRIIVKFAEGVQVRLRGGTLTAIGGSLGQVETVLAAYPDANVQRLFSVDERILDENRDTGQRISGKQLADLNNYYLVTLPEPGPHGVNLANELLSLDVVETAYLEAPAAPAACGDLPPTTPLWESNQFYLDPAPDGVDAWYARSYHSAGDGAGPGFWICDLEWDWCMLHEDIDIEAADVLNGHTSNSDPKFMNHGTAVLGVVGACENSYGVTGITPDVTIKMADRDSETSWAANIATADVALVAGEVMLLEVHILGPSTGNPCDAVCGNCDQYEYVPVEWDQASFDAISTCTANGLVVVEAAGNGQMDLDAAVYGGKFNRAVRDCGAILVGAAAPTTHSPICWSNYGSAVDVHGYGTNIYTAGYGYLWGQTGCRQDYDYDFGGTSGASPMVMGAAVALQGIANQKYSYDLLPSQMRVLIKEGGTPQGAPVGDHIGPMPDLLDAINAMEPDLVPYQAAGWDYAAVPRSTSDATAGSVGLIPGALPSSTYWNWTMRNQSSYSGTIAGPQTLLFLDDTGLWVAGTDLPAGGWGYVINVGPNTVKGGRHTVITHADYYGVEGESNESNNDFYRQYIWAATTLAQDTPTTRTADPVATSHMWGPYYNAEGVQAATGSRYWYAFAVLPTNAASDFDVRLNTEQPMNVPREGFGAAVAWSSDVAGAIDFVVLDRNEVPSGTYWASVLNFSGASAGDKVVEFDADHGVLTNPGTSGPYTLAAGNLIELHEISLASGTETGIHVRVLSGGADFGISVYDTDSGYHDKLSTLPGGYADNGGPFENEYVVVNPATNGYCGLAVWKKDTAQLGQSLTYEIVVGQDPNLAHAVPTGWYGPVVPRNSTDATSNNVPLPPTLTGNQTTTSFNFSVLNQGPNAASVASGYWDTRLWADDVWYWTGYATSVPSGQFGMWINTAQGYDPYSLLRGGRHHLRVTADIDDDILEMFETDNDYTEWFVWTPLDLADQTPVARATPPLKNPVGFGPYYSSDGFRAAPGGYWTAVGILPLGAGDDYDLRLFNASTGSKNGFGSYLAWSTASPGYPDWCIVNRNTTPSVDTDYGAINYNGGAGDFIVQRADGVTLGSVLPPMRAWGPYAIGPDDVLDFYEAYIAAKDIGKTLWISLDVEAGDANLGLAMYDAAGTYYQRFDAIAAMDAAGAGGDEHLAPWPITAAGWYGFAVHKSASGDVGKGAQYRLVFSFQNAVDAPETASLPTKLALAAPRPNPFQGRSQIAYDLPQDAPVRIAVFDLAGRNVVSLVDEVRPAGRHAVTWDGRDRAGDRVAAGIYFVRLESRDFRQVRKVTVIR